jgi:hypothetical protein
MERRAWSAEKGRIFAEFSRVHWAAKNLAALILVWEERGTSPSFLVCMVTIE